MNYNELKEKYRKKGYTVPSIDLIKNDNDIEKIKKAGEINTKVLDLVAQKIRVGMSTLEIDQIVYDETIRLGGMPAPLNYQGYPKSCCTSVNDVVCHGIPSKDKILKDGDIINVDCTTILDGYYADASRMFIIGTPSNDAKKIVDIAYNALMAGLSVVKGYVTLGDIGYEIEKYCNSNGCSVVHEIGGHGIGKNFHEDPYVAHFGKKNTGMVLFPGMVITIEPMVNLGKRYVVQDALDGWTIYTADGSLSAQFEHTILITEDGYEILAK